MIRERRKKRQERIKIRRKEWKGTEEKIMGENARKWRAEKERSGEGEEKKKRWEEEERRKEANRKTKLHNSNGEHDERGRKKRRGRTKEDGKRRNEGIRKVEIEKRRTLRGDREGKEGKVRNGGGEKRYGTGKESYWNGEEKDRNEERGKKGEESRRRNGKEKKKEKIEKERSRRIVEERRQIGNAHWKERKGSIRYLCMHVYVRVLRAWVCVCVHKCVVAQTDLSLMLAVVFSFAAVCPFLKW
jgi:hypothetical protein